MNFLSPPLSLTLMLSLFIVLPCIHPFIHPSIQPSMYIYPSIFCMLEWWSLIFFPFPLRSVLLVHTPVILFYAVCFCFLYICYCPYSSLNCHFNNPFWFPSLLRTIYLPFSSTLPPLSFSLCSSIPSSHTSRLFLCHFLFLFLCSWVLFWHVCIPCIFV